VAMTEAEPERWMVRLAFAALPVSLIALFFTFLQWRSAERAADIAEHARQDAVTEAERQRADAKIALEAQTKRADQANTLAGQSAKAAQESASVASQSLNISERAYVEVGGIGIFCEICEHPGSIRPPANFPAEATAAFLVNIINYGRTPAYHVELNITRIKFPQQLPANFDFPEDASADSTIGTVPPDPINPLQARLPDRAEGILAIRGQVRVQRPPGQSAREYFYLFGHISYTDIFKQRRTSLFCREYHGPTEGIPENWTRCHVHDGEVKGFRRKKYSHPTGFATPQFYPPEPPNNLPALPSEKPPKL
jgi:hypothetical protein